MFRDWGLVLAMGLCFGAGVLIGLTLGPNDDITREETLRDAADELSFGREARETGKTSSSLPRLDAESEKEAANPPRQSHGALTGRVVSHEGEPVADLPLRLSTTDGEPIVLATDSEGAFSAEVERGTKYALSAESEDWTLEPSFNEGLDSLRAGDDVQALASRLYPVHVDVLLPDGGRPDEARVIYRQSGIRKEEVPWSVGEPELRLPRGMFTLFARTESFYRSSAATVLIDGESEPSVTIQLIDVRQGPSILGRVVVDPGDSWRQLSVSCRLEGKSVISEVELTEASPDFKFSLERPGRYELVLKRARSIALVQAVDVEAKEKSVELHLPSVGSDRSATLRVSDPWGRPVRGLQADILIDVGRRDSWEQAALISAPDDRTLVFYGEKELDVFSGQTEGTVQLSMKSEFGTLQIPAPPPGTYREVRFERPATGRFDCRGIAGMLKEGDELRLTIRQQGLNLQVSVGPDGFARIPALQPGRFPIQMSVHSQNRRWSYDIPYGEVVLESRDQTVPITLPGLYELTLRGRPLPGRRSFQLRSLDEPPVSRNVDGSAGHHTITFKYLVPGQYRLTSREEADFEQEVTIPSQTELAMDW
ncbi:MAG: hypothetical protein RL885_20825 [Planctomycetota bacterium]